MSRRLGVQCALCLLAALWAVVPWLGTGGLNASEGLRVAAGLDFVTRQGPEQTWLTQTIFEQPYLRKPPGLAWCIAVLYQTFGFSEWTFRLPSALAHLGLTALAFIFMHRITAPRNAPDQPSRPTLAPLATGLAAALSPLLWEFGRAAELEALTIFTGALACAGVMAHAMIRNRLEGFIWLSLAALGMTGTLLSKGPAMIPVITACLMTPVALASFFFKYDAALTKASGLRTSLWAFLQQFAALAIGAAAAILILIQVAVHTGSDSAVTQSPSEFLWATDRLTGILTLPIIALATMPPAAGAMIFLWLPRLSPGVLSPSLPRPVRDQVTSQIFLVAALVSIVVFALAGISNPRYAAPAIWPVLLIVGAAVTKFEYLRACIDQLATSSPADAQNLRKYLGFTRNLAIVVLIACLIAAPIYALLTHRSRVKNSGLTAATSMVTALQAPGVIFADDAIEARAEVLLYLRHLAQSQSPPIALRPIWLPGLDGDAIIERSSQQTGARYLLLRTDGRESEKAIFQRQNPAWKLTTLSKAKVHVFELELLRIDSF